MDSPESQDQQLTLPTRATYNPTPGLLTAWSPNPRAEPVSSRQPKSEFTQRRSGKRWAWLHSRLTSFSD